MIELKKDEDWDSCLEISNSETVMVLKYSNTCPVSQDAFDRVENGIKSRVISNKVYLVTVQTEREISNKIAEYLGVKHASPQLIIIKNGKEVANTSHFKITVDWVKENLVSAH